MRYGKETSHPLRLLEIQKRKEGDNGFQQSDFSNTIWFGSILYWSEDVQWRYEVDGQTRTHGSLSR